MKSIKLLLTLFSVLAITGGVYAQEPILKGGQSIILKITGVPQKDQADLNGPYSISDDGTIRLQFIGTVQAIGLRPSQLSAKIESAYRSAEIYTKPTINISVNAGDITSQSYVTVMGEVKAPRQVIYTTGMTISDALAQCSGFTDFADKRRIKFMRDGVEQILDLRQVGADDDIKLKPGDKIVVRQSSGPLGNLFNGR